GTLTYLEPQTWETLYPPAGGFYPNGGVLNNITDRLLFQNPETLELEPWIATDLPRSTRTPPNTPSLCGRTPPTPTAPRSTPITWSRTSTCTAPATPTGR